jgi:nucleotide-binding universal stress UspA family protein
MPKIKKILFPTNCSQNAKDAFKYTLAMAKYFGARIQLLYVCEPNVDLLVPSVMRFNLQQEQKLSAQKRLSSWAQEFEIHQIEMGQSVQMGFAKDSIAAYANKDKAIDLIVLGTKETNSITKVIWGSIISHTVEKSFAPVLVVPKGISFKDIQNIAFLTPDTTAWDKLYKPVKEIAHSFRAKLYITHLESSPFQAIEGERHVILEDYTYALSSFAYNVQLHLLITLSVPRNSFQRLFRYSKAQKMAQKTTIPLLLMKQ